MAPSVLPQFESLYDPARVVNASPVTVIANTPTDKYNSAAAEKKFAVSTARKVYSVIVTNISGADAFLQVFDAAAVPADTAVPMVSIPVANGLVQFYDVPTGIPLVNGLAACLSSTQSTKTLAGNGLFLAAYSL